MDISNTVVATSDWLLLTAAPQFLAAVDFGTGDPFPLVARIEIEHLPTGTDARYSMDDLIVIPEPVSLVLLALGSGFMMRRRCRN